MTKAIQYLVVIALLRHVLLINTLEDVAPFSNDPSYFAKKTIHNFQTRPGEDLPTIHVLRSLFSIRPLGYYAMFFEYQNKTILRDLYREIPFNLNITYFTAPNDALNLKNVAEAIMEAPAKHIASGTQIFSIHPHFTQLARDFNMVHMDWKNEVAQINKPPFQVQLRFPSHERYRAVISFVKWKGWKEFTTLKGYEFQQSYHDMDPMWRENDIKEVKLFAYEKTDFRMRGVLTGVDEKTGDSTFRLPGAMERLSDERAAVRKLRESEPRLIVAHHHYLYPARRPENTDSLCNIGELFQNYSKAFWINANKQMGLYQVGVMTEMNPDRTCTIPEYVSAADRQIYIEPYPSAQYGWFTAEWRIHGTNVTIEEFESSFIEWRKRHYSFDSSLVMSTQKLLMDDMLVLIETLKQMHLREDPNEVENAIARSDYNDTRFPEMFMRNLKHAKLTGFFGPYDFDSNGGRMAPIYAFQFDSAAYEKDRKKVMVPIALYNSTTNRWIEIKSIIYPHGNRFPDRIRNIREKQPRVADSLGIAVAAAIALAACLSFGLIVFQFRYREHEVVRLSSPRLNIIALSGCVLIWLAATYNLIGLELPQLCWFSVAFQSIGLSLIFTVLVLKLYRVKHVTKVGGKKKKAQSLRDVRLIVLIPPVVLIDIAIIAAFSLIKGPYQIRVDTVSTYVDQSDFYNATLVLKTLPFCEHPLYNEMRLSLIIFNSLIMLVALILAVQTNQVKIEELNDSFEVGVCTYVIAVIAIIFGTVGATSRSALLTEHSFDLALLLIAIICSFFLYAKNAHAVVTGKRTTSSLNRSAKSGGAGASNVSKT